MAKKVIVVDAPDRPTGEAALDPGLRRMTRVQRWERRTEIPLLLLASAFLVAYAWPILDPRLDHDTETFLAVLSWTVWGAFAVDLVIRLALADERAAYAVRHWYDIVLVVVPMLRPLRLLRLLAFARILGRSATRNLAGRVTLYVIGTAIAAVGLGALAVLDAERDAPGATITTFGDALWWAATTVTTVGYGDVTPANAWGRIVAAVIMLESIAFVAIITAAITSNFVERARRQAAEAAGEADHVAAELAGMREQLTQIQRQLDELSRGGPPAPSS